MKLFGNLKQNTKKAERRFDFNTLRFRLTLTFVAFAVALMALLWIMQIVFLQNYYEKSMEKRNNMTLDILSSVYSTTQSLDFNDFCTKIAEFSSDADMYLYVEAVDGSFTISSSDQQTFGRNLSASFAVERAKAMLVLGENKKVSFSLNIERSAELLISACIVESSYRKPIYIFSAVAVTPLGPAVSILSGQLMFVTIVSIIMGGILAAIFAKRLAKPIIEIKDKAKQMTSGNLDVDFEVKGYTEVEDLAETLTRTADNLAAAEALQKDLVANISHDLRTPLTMIKSYAELIRDISGEKKEKRDAHLEVIIEETDRLSDLVGDILTLSKLQSGSEKMEPSSWDPEKAAESVLGVYKVLEENDGFVFNFEHLQTPVSVYADERRIKQVMANLISNAVRYSGDGKRIDIVFSMTDDNRVKFTVKDRGIGIAPEDIDKIWNRYEKASKQGTRNQNGTGLGLSIAREILQLHGAQYGVESTLGEGSSFWFTLPIEISEETKNPQKLDISGKIK